MDRFFSLASQPLASGHHENGRQYALGTVEVCQWNQIPGSAENPDLLLAVVGKGLLSSHALKPIFQDLPERRLGADCS